MKEVTLSTIETVFSVVLISEGSDKIRSRAVTGQP
jgi:hypothetical protein